ncbi:MAG: 4Fe-4S binding protein [Proteobacteria bacterium]|nr:4Fe-4S binding protein [Pseudomonadota bacterium]MCP4916609.1 4Fe-4S binding protein [Pseudomonadota bacterium]
MNRILRGLTQSSVLALLAAVPMVQIWAVGTHTRWSPEELDHRYGPLADPVTSLMTSVFGEPGEVAGVVTGGIWSIGLGPVELADPVALGTLLTAGVVPPMALALGGLLVLALHVLLGRVFCGYLCPYGTISRLVSRLRPTFAVQGGLPRWLGYVVLAVALVAPMLGLSVVPWLPYAGVGAVLQGLVFGSWVPVAVVVGVLLASDVFLWEHGVCRSLCPSGALQTLVGRWRLLRLEPVRKVPCTGGCHLCAEVCWLGLDPRAGATGPDCDQCGRCIGVCPASRLVLRRPGKAS